MFLEWVKLIEDKASFSSAFHKSKPSTPMIGKVNPWHRIWPLKRDERLSRKDINSFSQIILCPQRGGKTMKNDQILKFFRFIRGLINQFYLQIPSINLILDLVSILMMIGGARIFAFR